jgi:hypothetical protein
MNISAAQAVQAASASLNSGAASAAAIATSAGVLYTPRRTATFARSPLSRLAMRREDPDEPHSGDRDNTRRQRPTSPMSGDSSPLERRLLVSEEPSPVERRPSAGLKGLSNNDMGELKRRFQTQTPQSGVSPSHADPLAFTAPSSSSASSSTSSSPTSSPQSKKHGSRSRGGGALQRVSAQYRRSEPSEQKGGDLLNDAAARAAKRLGLDDGGGVSRLGTIAPRNSMNRDAARDSIRETMRGAGREGGREVAGRDEEVARRGESPRGSSRGSSLNGGSSGSMRGGGHDDDYGFSPRRRALSNMSNMSQESEDATSHSAGVDEWRMSAPTSTTDDGGGGGATAASVSNRTHRTSSASSTGSVRSSSAYLPTSEGGTDSSSTRCADAGRGRVREQGEGRVTTAGMLGTSDRLSQQQLPAQSLDTGGGRGRGWGGGGGYDRRRDGYDRRKDDDELPQVYFDDEGELRFLDATTSVDSREIAQDCIEFTQREEAGGAVRVWLV